MIKVMKLSLVIFIIWVNLDVQRCYSDAAVNDDNRSSNEEGYTSPSLRSRHHFDDKTIYRLNNQIRVHMQAYYVFQAYSHYFDRSDVALPGMHAFLKKLSDDEREHADKLMAYMHKRGGSIRLEHPIRIPDGCEEIHANLPEIGVSRMACICHYISPLSKKHGKSQGCKGSPEEWYNSLQAVEDALALHKHMNTELITVHRKSADPHLQQYLEDAFLDHQIHVIKKLADYITQLRRVGAGLGEFMFDKYLS